MLLVECLYIGKITASHLLARVRNITRDRAVAWLPAAAAVCCLSASDASLRDANVWYRCTRFLVPSGAISVSHQRIAHPLPLFRRYPVPYCRLVR